MVLTFIIMYYLFSTLYTIGVDIGDEQPMTVLTFLLDITLGWAIMPIRLGSISQEK